ncbi:MAG: response regulator [Candidatus Lokiarchaeota archaeon]|nr:response regulator [Candidatus Lokiarchaeota archaeon]
MSDKNLSENDNPKGQNKRHLILIVDDEPDILNLTEKFLKLDPNFDTITSANAKEAMSVLEERYHDISLILLDVMMPGRSGMDVLRQIKAEERYNHIKVILFTVKSFNEDIQKGNALGADGYIIKPFSGKDLLKFVQDKLA